MNGDNCRKAFHFDLDRAKLKEFYPSKSKNGYKRAWADIRTLTNLYLLCFSLD